MESLLIGAAGGLIAGGVLLFVEYLVRRREKHQEKEQQQIVKFTNEERRITGSIFNYLGPRSSIELMKSELGPPNKKSREQIGLFYDQESNNGPNSDSNELEQLFDVYIYFFKNASVKITSKDGETIESLTVWANDKDISFPIYDSLDGETREEFLNDARITEDMAQSGRTESFPGCRDMFSAVQNQIGMPFRIYVTYFCEFSDEAESLVGSVINAICFSSEGNTANYIFVADLV